MKIDHLKIIIVVVLLAFGCKAQQNHLPTGSNHLIHETSPYLQQHANNPVDWYPWSEEALQKAKKEDKLIIISIGYSACHWCHVMEHESFEDSTVAEIMNNSFVNIKVDREERPDVDDVYMTACQLSSGEACGWPLNAIALPNGKPVWAGTYFPKKRWLEILDYFIKARENEYDKLNTYADQLQQGLASAELVVGDISGDQIKVSEDEMSKINQDFLNLVDWKHGGTKGAPKFPIPNNYLMLTQMFDHTGDQKIKEALELTLNKMAGGGIYDQLGGGFARYTVDAEWMVPHFEKMLYDNSQLISVYSKAFQLTQNPTYRKVVYETIEFVKRELYDVETSSFYSSLDADSEGEEGKFYVWTYDEVEEAIPNPDIFKVFLDYFNIKSGGNWEEGKNILHHDTPLEKIATKYNTDEAQLEDQITQGKKSLFEVRQNRIRPGLDDKILTSWNALMIRGLLDAYQAFGDDTFLDMAIGNYDFIAKKMILPDNRLLRTYKDEKAHINGFLDDYAHLIQALLKLYESTFDFAYLQKAKELTDYAIKHFHDSESGFFYYTSDLDPPLIVRKKEITDNVTPSSNSTMMRNLYYLHLYFGTEEYMTIVESALQAMQEPALNSKQPNFYSNWIIAMTQLAKPPFEIAIVGQDYEEKRKELATHFLPNAKFLGGAEEGELSLLKDKKVEGETMIYVCQNKVCKFPVSDVNEALKLMQD